MAVPTLFRGKQRDDPITFTATAKHREMLIAASTRLGISRSDTLAVLIEKHADALTVNDLPAASTRPRLRPSPAALIPHAGSAAVVR